MAENHNANTVNLNHHYSTIGSGSMYPNACYEFSKENHLHEMQQDKKDVHSKRGSSHTCRRALILLLAIAALVISASGICTALVLKYLVTNPMIASLQNELYFTKVNLSMVVEAVSSTGLYSTFPAASCASILNTFDTSKSGYYWIKTSNGSSVRMFCDMERTCEETTGGWTRVANLNITDPSMQCPSGLIEHTFLTDIRTCTQPSYTRSCVSVFYNTEGIEYSRICGRISGYQYGSTDSFFKEETTVEPLTLDSNYVDGVSLTRGTPREHIWTFAAGHCMDSCHYHSPHFIHTDYFCDGVMYPNCMDFCNITLWNGDQCDLGTNWFYNQLPQRKSDAIEMRLCQDEGSTSEQTPITEVELYIQ